MNSVTNIPIKFSQVHQAVQNFTTYFNSKADFESQLKRSSLYELLPPNRATITRKPGKIDERRYWATHPEYLEIQLYPELPTIKVGAKMRYDTGRCIKNLQGGHKAALHTTNESINVLKMRKDRCATDKLTSLIWEAWMMHKYKNVPQIISGNYGLYPGFKNPVKGMIIPKLWGSIGCLLLCEELENHEKLSIALQITQAIKAIHDKGDLYLDLKPDQVILHKNNNSSISAYLTDLASISVEGTFFDLCKNWKKHEDVPGTLHALPPELKRIVIQLYDTPNSKVDPFEIKPKKLDIWTLGLLFHFLIDFKDPRFCTADRSIPNQNNLDYNSNYSINGSHLKTKTWEQFSQEASAFSADQILLGACYFCCKINPNERPNIDQILSLLQNVSPRESQTTGTV